VPVNHAPVRLQAQRVAMGALALAMIRAPKVSPKVTLKRRWQIVGKWLI